MVKRSKKSIAEVRKGLERRKNPASGPEAKIDKSRSRTLQEVLTDIEEIEFNCTSVCRIDDDLHDIFTRLKNRKGVPIGRIISVILKDFFESNRKEIKGILDENKYL